MRTELNCNAGTKTGKNIHIKVIIVAAFTLLISVSVMADCHKNSNISEEKSGNPMTSLHPAANQAAAAAHYKSVEKTFSTELFR